MPESTDDENTDIAASVRRTLTAELALPEGTSLDADDLLDELPNADSVRLMRAVSKLEREFDIELEDEDVHEAKTVGELAALVARSVNAAQ